MRHQKVQFQFEMLYSEIGLQNIKLPDNDKNYHDGRMKYYHKNKSLSIQIASGDASRVLSTKRLIYAYVYCYINIRKNYGPIKYYHNIK